MRLLKYFSKLTAEYYPEILGTCFIINAPFVFTTIFAIVKGWLDEKTRNKIKVYGTNYRDDLFTFCPPSSIPKSFGGSYELDLHKDTGPWHEYELIDGFEPGKVVGVRRIGDI